MLNIGIIIFYLHKLQRFGIFFFHKLLIIILDLIKVSSYDTFLHTISQRACLTNAFGLVFLLFMFFYCSLRQKCPCNGRKRICPCRGIFGRGDFSFIWHAF
jgi:hypothetical protein